MIEPSAQSGSGPALPVLEAPTNIAADSPEAKQHYGGCQWVTGRVQQKGGWCVCHEKPTFLQCVRVLV